MRSTTIHQRGPAAVLGALSAFLLAACGTGGDPGAAPPTSTTASSVPAAPPSSAPLSPAPGEPVIGTRYAYDLYVHCGIEFAAFAGRTWKAEQPLPEPRPTPDERGITTYTGYLPGTAVLVDRDTLEFANDRVGTVRFHPVDQEPSPCE
ncbi:hypothetical protein [Saccharothrix syringae]|uniref:NlpE C-terminal OB domain-containing protein n=1 Tax=Saccharothrix syringae TaxID=103733 RepID=A0A5Q0H1D8_SACSY|nr:hypothetical protein [Saccharothrix syringae]QFZ19725.1 hypothetical protein EKG83_21860 [Saccharothrix syringae]